MSCQQAPKWLPAGRPAGAGLAGHAAADAAGGAARRRLGRVAARVAAPVGRGLPQRLLEHALAAPGRAPGQARHSRRAARAPGPRMRWGARHGGRRGWVLWAVLGAMCQFSRQAPAGRTARLSYALWCLACCCAEAHGVVQGQLPTGTLSPCVGAHLSKGGSNLTATGCPAPMPATLPRRRRGGLVAASAALDDAHPVGHRGAGRHGVGRAALLCAPAGFAVARMQVLLRVPVTEASEGRRVSAYAPVQFQKLWCMRLSRRVDKGRMRLTMGAGTARPALSRDMHSDRGTCATSVS